MGFAFPVMKPIIEEQVRRVTVAVTWKEGDKEQSFEVVQFLVNELPILPPSSDEDDVILLGAPDGVRTNLVTTKLVGDTLSLKYRAGSSGIAKVVELTVQHADDF